MPGRDPHVGGRSRTDRLCARPDRARRTRDSGRRACPGREAPDPAGGGAAPGVPGWMNRDGHRCRWQRGPILGRDAAHTEHRPDLRAVQVPRNPSRPRRGLSACQVGPGARGLRALRSLATRTDLAWTPRCPPCGSFGRRERPTRQGTSAPHEPRVSDDRGDQSPKRAVTPVTRAHSPPSRRTARYQTGRAGHRPLRCSRA